MDITFSVFPKYYSHLDPRGLAAMAREVGLDTTNAVIRDGYWVTPAGLAQELPAFVKAMEQEGLKITFATSGFSTAEVKSNPDILKILCDSGITHFRMSYFRIGEGGVRESLALARREMEDMAGLCERQGIRAVYQVHHGTLIPNASAAWTVVGGLPYKWIGVELDPGNQSFEGFENWNRSVPLLGEYLCAVGIKDSTLVRDPGKAGEPGKGWKRTWAPLDEGMTNWYDLLSALRDADFGGTFVFMPFYDERDPETMTAKLKREVEYLRRVTAEVESR